MINLYIENNGDFKRADLFEDTLFSLNKQLTDLEDLTALIVDYTKSVELPRSLTNDALFNYSYNTNRQQLDIDTSKRINCKLIGDNNVLLEGYCILNNADSDKYVITIYGQLGNIFQKLKDIKFDDICDPIVVNAEYVANCFKNGIPNYEGYGKTKVYISRRFTLPMQVSKHSSIRIICDNLDLISPGITGYNIYREVGNPLSIYMSPFISDQTYRPSVKYSKQINEISFLYAKNRKGQNREVVYRINLNNELKIDNFFDPNEIDIDFSNIELPAGWYNQIKIIDDDTKATWIFTPTIEKGQIMLKDATSGLTILADDIDMRESIYNVIGYCATHQGLYKEFESTLSERGDISMDAYNDSYDGLTEHTIKEFRSYYQQPYLYLRPMMERLQDYINYSNEFDEFKLIYDNNWFNADNPYFSRLVMMCLGFNDRSDEHKDGPENPFYLNDAFIGDMTKDCEKKVDDSVKMTFNQVPHDFNVLNNDTIQKPSDVKLFKGNLAHTWTCNLTESRNNIVHNRNKITLHFLVSISNQINLKWWGGTHRFNDNSNWKEGDAKLNIFNPFIVSIQTGSHTSKFGFYTPVSSKHPNQLIQEQTDFFNQNDVALKDRYPIETNTETYFDETTNMITFLWDLGIGDMGFLSTTDVDFTYSIKMLNPLLKLEPGFEMEGAFGDYNIDFLYDCVDYAGIPLGALPYDKDQYLSNEIFQGNIFYSDYDSRRTNSTILPTDILKEEDSPFNILTKYAKMFRLYFDVDYFNKTITLRDNFFNNYEIEDWTNKVDFNTFKVYPVINNDKYIKYGYEKTDMKYNALNISKTDLSYGDSLLTTDIETLNNTKTLFEDMAPSCTSQEYYPSWGANTYTNIMSKETCPVAINNNNATKANSVSIYGSYYFINHPQQIGRFFDFAAADQTKSYYLISDDTYDQIANNKYCWNLHGEKVESNKFSYVDFITDDNQFGCIWSQPNNIYNNKNEGSSRRYIHYIDDLWQNYLSEIYNPNNKKVTCDLYMSEIDYANFKFNKLVVINNVLYLVNKISNFTGTGMTQVELLQISDPTNLMSQYDVINETNDIRNPQNRLK